MEEDTCQCFSAGGSGPQVGPQEARTESLRRWMMCLRVRGRDELCVLMRLRSTEMMEDKKKKKKGQSIRIYFVLADKLWGPTERAGLRLSPNATPRE